MDKERLLHLVTVENDIEAAQSLYMLCGREKDWDTALIALNLLIGRNVLIDNIHHIFSDVTSRLERLEISQGMVHPSTLSHPYDIPIFEEHYFDEKFLFEDDNPTSTITKKYTAYLENPVNHNSFLLQLDLEGNCNSFIIRETYLTVRLEIRHPRWGTVKLPSGYICLQPQTIIESRSHSFSVHKNLYLTNLDWSTPSFNERDKLEITLWMSFYEPRHMIQEITLSGSYKLSANKLDQ